MVGRPLDRLVRPSSMYAKQIASVLFTRGWKIGHLRKNYFFNRQPQNLFLIGSPHYYVDELNMYAICIYTCIIYVLSMM